MAVSRGDLPLGVGRRDVDCVLIPRAAGLGNASLAELLRDRGPKLADLGTRSDMPQSGIGIQPGASAPGSGRQTADAP